MKNIWMLAKANMRKSKSQSVSLLIFVLIATTLLNVGLVLFTGVGDFFDKRAEELNMPHAYIMYSQDGDVNNGIEYVQNYPGVNEIEVLHGFGGMGQYTAGDTESTGYLFFFREDDAQKMDAPSLMGESMPLEGDAIYLPGFMMENGGPQVGENFEVGMYGQNLIFTIAGANEELTFGSPMNTVFRFYLSDEKYDELLAVMPESEITMLGVRMNNAEDAELLQQKYSREMPQDGVALVLGYEVTKMSRTTFPVIVSIMIVAFALVLLIVSLIIIRFRIINNIQESMTNIGTLKAVGYKTRQIVASIVLQFGIITLTGAIIGVILATVLLPVVAGVLKSQIALEWVPGFELVPAAIALFAVLILVLLITFASARKIKKLHPLIALRGGISTHNFKKNSLPLDKTRGPLNLLLALKQLLKNKKQSAMMAVIMAAVALALVVGLTLHYSMNVNTDAFIRNFFGEVPDISVVVKNKSDGDMFVQSMRRNTNVRKVYGYEMMTVALDIDGTDNRPAVVDDFAMLEGNMILEGEYPVHNNEIAIGAATARATGKGVGDTVLIKYEDVEKEFIVSAIVQYTNFGGFNGIISADALREMYPDYEFYAYNIYLEEGVDLDAFIEDIHGSEGDIFMSINNMATTMEGMLSSMGSIMALVAVAIVAITFVVIVLALYMVIKTTILRRKREFGIQKAVGFTTRQIMNQIALNFTPAIIIGVIIGVIIGAITFNPMCAIMMASMGIVKANLQLPMDWLVIASLSLVVITYVISLAVSYRIRKITAYALVSE